MSIVESETHGFCMGRAFENRIALIDTEAPIESGHVVRVIVRMPATGREHHIIKQLEASRDGRWWLCCMEGVIGIGPLVPTYIHRVVDTLNNPNPKPFDPAAPDYAGIRGTRAELEHADRISLDVRAEWTERGKLRGVPFPGIEAAMRAAGFEWDPIYRPERAA